MFVEPSRKWPIWKFASKESLTYTAGQNFKVQPPSEDGEATLQAGCCFSLLTAKAAQMMKL